MLVIRLIEKKNAGSREGAAGGEAADVALEASLIR